jgi:hypothetical protein
MLLFTLPQIPHEQFSISGGALLDRILNHLEYNCTLILKLDDTMHLANALISHLSYTQLSDA